MQDLNKKLLVLYIILKMNIFVFSLELSNHRRRLHWEATPRSIHEGVAVAISQSDCLSFDTNHAQLFAENGNLGINVTINNISNNNNNNNLNII